MRNKIPVQIQALLLLAGILAVIAGWLYISPMRPQTASANYSSYTKYLKFTFGNAEDILVYTEKAGDREEDGIYVTVQNTSEFFWCGTLELTDGQGNILYRERMINLAPNDVAVRKTAGSVQIADYKVRGSKFYRFTYEKPAFSAYISYDRDKGQDYVWGNLLLDKEALNTETLREYAKYHYVFKILEGKKPEDIYCYDEKETKYREENGIRYPERDSAVFVIVFDNDGRTIRIVDPRANMEVLEEFSMK
ncbi:MAG: hypothetical protein II186_03345 [Erysipelotrichales bacterium]|nr:hypothetical protein [Erysipelotrichales bacterium]